MLFNDQSPASDPRIYLVNASSAHPFGNTEFAETIWLAAIDLSSDSYESDTTTTFEQRDRSS